MNQTCFKLTNWYECYVNKTLFRTPPRAANYMSQWFSWSLVWPLIGKSGVPTSLNQFTSKCFENHPQQSGCSTCNTEIFRVVIISRSEVSICYQSIGRSTNQKLATTSPDHTCFIWPKNFIACMLNSLDYQIQSSLVYLVIFRGSLAGIWKLTSRHSTSRLWNRPRL